MEGDAGTFPGLGITIGVGLVDLGVTGGPPLPFGERR